MPTVARGTSGRLPGANPVLYAGGTAPADQARATAPPLMNQTTVAPTAPFTPPPLPSGGGTPTFTPFGGTAPTPTPYGDFTVPDALNFQQDPSYQFRFNEGQKALQRSAAARGTLLSGGFAKALQNYGQQAASQEYGNAYDRAMQGYLANRDTNAQNYGQLMGQYNAGLEGWKANTGAQLDYARLAQDAEQGDYDRAYQESRDRYAYDQTVNNTNTMRTNLAQAQADDAYARAVEEQRRQNAAYTQMRGGMAPRPQAPRRDIANYRQRG